MTDQKIENLLNLALEATPQEREKSLNLNVGFSADLSLWDVIVKYSGDIRELENENIQVVPLLNQYAIVTLPQEEMGYFSQNPWVEYMEKPKRLFFASDQGKRVSCIQSVQNAAYDLTGRGVLVAVIDSGVDYTHMDFRNEDGSTRILYLWDQTADPDRRETVFEGKVYYNKPPKGYKIGIEYSEERINTALRAGDEGRQLVPERDVSGHGTGVLGIAAGNGRMSMGRYRGIAFESPILIVKLGSPRQQSDGFPRTTELMQAVDYVIRKSTELGMPVVINLSFGNSYGSHDGSSLISDYLNDVSDVGRTVICVGTGNEADKAGHTQGFVREGAAREIPFAVSPGESTINIQIWKNYVDIYDIALVLPSGIRIGPLRREPGVQRFRGGGTELLVYYGEPGPYSRAQEIYMDFLPEREYLEEGIWKIELIPERIVQGNYDMWMPSSAVLNTGTGFLFPSEETTLTIPSAAGRVVSVGAYDAATDAYADFSGRGYTRENREVKPDLIAPGVGVMTAAPGGGYQARTGTSFAVPFVSGAAALLMQEGIVEGKDPYMYGEKVKAQLIYGARHLRSEEDYPNRKTGWGALCLRESMPYRKI